MDILNFISWIRGGRKVTTVDPAKTLIPVGLKDNRRDDGYLPGVITVADLQGNQYKAYIASLTQEVDNPPQVMSLFENSLEVTPIFTREDVGIYTVEFDKPVFYSPFDYCVINNGTTVVPGDTVLTYNVIVRPIWESAALIMTTINGEYSDTVLSPDDTAPNAILEIRVYPNAEYIF